MGHTTQRVSAGNTPSLTSAALPPLGPYRHVAYLQRYVEGGRPGFDWRVLVIGSSAVAAMRRVGGKGWIHNFAQGARCEAAELDEALARTALSATAALGLDYAGVDLIPNPADASRPLVLEVNGVAAWRGLQSVTPVDIAGALADDLLQRRLGLTESAADADGSRVIALPKRHA